jgi:hypothetical protein
MAISPTSTGSLTHVKTQGSPFIEELLVTFDSADKHNTVYSPVFDKRGTGTVIFLLVNSCDKNLGVVIEEGFDSEFSAGSFVAIAVQTVETATTEHAVVSEPWPFIRLKVTPADLPTEDSVTFYAASADRGRD